MNITREQVADLRAGDVVELSHSRWPEGTVVRGPLWLDHDTLQVGAEIVRHWDGRHPYDSGKSLTVISRAPRPLYVNHDRTEPVPGDVVRLAQPHHEAEGYTNIYLPQADSPRRPWVDIQDGYRYSHEQAFGSPGQNYRATLLVDGTTGQATP